MTIELQAIVAATAVALIALSGVFIFRKSGYLTGTHRFVLPFAVGTFLGVVFFELIPETIELNHELGPVAIAIGFLGFYLLSHFLHTFHHHHYDHSDECSKDGARKLLIGDAVHNIADGIVIATAFLIDPAVGIAATVGILLHEIPQEIVEYGVLIANGYSKKRAAFLNVLSASSILLGVLGTFLFVESLPEWLFIFTGIAAGNLLYIATTDLLPEVMDDHGHHFWQTFISTILGVVIIGAIIQVSHAKVGHGHPAHEEVHVHEGHGYTEDDEHEDHVDDEEDLHEENHEHAENEPHI